MKDVVISDDYITLGQMLKKTDIVSTGGEVKFFLQETRILLNGEAEARRGKKLYPNDIVDIEGFGRYKIASGRASD